MEYEAFRKMQKQILSCASFNDIAPVAIYLYADVQLKIGATAALKRLKQKCSSVPEVREMDAKDIIDGRDVLGFDGLYNEKFEEILGEHGLRTWIDKWGAKCYEDARGVKHCGDDSGFYPWVTNETTLKEKIKAEGIWSKRGE